MPGDCCIEGCWLMATGEVRSGIEQTYWLPVCERHMAIYAYDGLETRVSPSRGRVAAQRKVMAMDEKWVRRVRWARWLWLAIFVLWCASLLNWILVVTGMTQMVVI